MEHLIQLVDGGHDGEEAGCLDVFEALDVVGREAALGQPLDGGTPHERGAAVGQWAAEGVVETIGAQHIATLAQGDDVYADTARERDLPVVFGHAGDDMLGRELPSTAQHAVLHPYIMVLCREGA